MDSVGNGSGSGSGEAPTIKTENIPVTKEKRKSAAGRQLIRWDFEKDQHLLLCLEYVCNKKGIQLPWDEAVQYIKPGATGQAAIQHLTKVRKYRQERGQDVPPEPIKRRLTKRDAANLKKRKAADEDEDEDYEQAYKGSTSRMVYQPIGMQTSKRKKTTSAPTPSTIVPKSAGSATKAPRNRRPKIKKEPSPSPECAEVEGPKTANSEDEWVPTGGSTPPAKSHFSMRPPSLDPDDFAIMNEASWARGGLRAIEDINYAEPEIEEDINEEDGYVNVTRGDGSFHTNVSEHAHGAHEENAEQVPTMPTFRVPDLQRTAKMLEETSANNSRDAAFNTNSSIYEDALDKSPKTRLLQSSYRNPGPVPGKGKTSSFQDANKLPYEDHDSQVGTHLPAGQDLQDRLQSTLRAEYGDLSTALDNNENYTYDNNTVESYGLDHGEFDNHGDFDSHEDFNNASTAYMDLNLHSSQQQLSNTQPTYETTVAPVSQSSTFFDNSCTSSDYFPEFSSDLGQLSELSSFNTRNNSFDTRMNEEFTGYGDFLTDVESSLFHHDPELPMSNIVP